MLDGLLIEQVRADEQLAGMLATFKKNPAFFYQKSPSDTAKGWKGGTNYPRADYTVDMRSDPERKKAGTLTINIWCSTQSAAMPEDIEARIVEIINGTFYTANGSDTVCAVWSGSEAFDFEGKGEGISREPEIFGVTVLFDLLAFPVQITTDPDPTEGLIAFTKRNFPAVTVISADKTAPIFKPTDEHPAIYWRFIGSTTAAQNFSVSWFNGAFAAHIIASTIAERNRWIKAITETMQAAGEVILPDGSPMFINRLEIRHDSDPLREGQLAVTGQYGVLTAKAKLPAQIPLNNAHFQQKTEVKFNGKT